MTHPAVKILPGLNETIRSLDPGSISRERKEVLQPLVDYINQNQGGHTVNLNFICTHNSRRSQFAQVWAQTAAGWFGVSARCFSGGVEVTAFNPRAVESLKRSGFRVERNGNENPVYQLFFAEDAEPVTAFSKLYDDPTNPKERFAAVMTCSDADENCPFIPGAEKRVALNYKDPKEFDGTPQETGKYDERSRQIATEMFYVFSKIKK